MAKGASKNIAEAGNIADCLASLPAALAKRTKNELIDALVEFAGEDQRFARRLAARFALETSAQEIAAATRRAIADATAFDERDANSNFDYDYAAYDLVKRNLGRLIQLGEPRLAMELSLELMEQGSAQVEMSDEGLMTEDIEECLAVVVSALKKSDLPARDVVSWCGGMSERDRVGFIYDEELRALQKHFQDS